MSILDLARTDLQGILNDVDLGFTQDVTFVTPDGLTTATIKGLVSVHHNAIDIEGNNVSSKVASLSFIEAELSATGYPIRDTDGVVYLERHRISASDSTGGVREYVVQEHMPDAMIGLIVLILEDFEV